MTTDTFRPKVPEPPSTDHRIAVALEITMLIVFIGNHSLLGVVLSGAYAYYSATWALFAKVFRDD
jgi:hypothetical protein